MTATVAPPLPARFHGLWRRHSIALDDGPAAEPALVLWWQGPERFVDVRWHVAGLGEADPIGLSVDRTMAGTTAYEPSGFLTWHHDADSYAGAGADRSAVRWDGDDLVEEGGIPGASGRRFREVWRRVGVEVPEIVDDLDHGTPVRVARSGRWSATLSFPTDPADPAMPGRVRLECRNPAATWVLEGNLGAGIPGAHRAPGSPEPPPASTMPQLSEHTAEGKVQ